MDFYQQKTLNSYKQPFVFFVFQVSWICRKPKSMEMKQNDIEKMKASNCSNLGVFIGQSLFFVQL